MPKPDIEHLLQRALTHTAPSPAPHSFDDAVLQRLRTRCRLQFSPMRTAAAGACAAAVGFCVTFASLSVPPPSQPAELRSPQPGAGEGQYSSVETLSIPATAPSTAAEAPTAAPSANGDAR